MEFVKKACVLIMLICTLHHTDAPPIRTITIYNCEVQNKPCILQNAQEQRINPGDDASITWSLAIPSEMTIKLYGALSNISLINYDVPIITGRTVSSKFGDWTGWKPEYQFSPQDGYHLLKITISLVNARIEDAIKTHLEFYVGEFTYKTGHVLLFNVTNPQKSSSMAPDNQLVTTTQSHTSVCDSITSSPPTAKTSEPCICDQEILDILHEIKLALHIIIGILTVRFMWTIIKLVAKKIYSRYGSSIRASMQQCYDRLRLHVMPCATQSRSTTHQQNTVRDNDEQEQVDETSTTDLNSTAVLGTGDASQSPGHDKYQPGTAKFDDPLTPHGVTTTGNPNSTESTSAVSDQREEKMEHGEDMIHFCEFSQPDMSHEQESILVQLEDQAQESGRQGQACSTIIDT